MYKSKMNLVLKVVIFVLKAGVLLLHWECHCSSKFKTGEWKPESKEM